GSMFVELMGIATEQLVQAIAFDASAPTEPLARIKLDASLSSYLIGMEAVLALHSGVLDQELTPENLENVFQSALAPIIAATTTEEADTNTASLRSALEWAFDAAADQDPTVSFIKTCIALEAALGEDQEQSQITERLADRCAFLLNETVT